MSDLIDRQNAIDDLHGKDPSQIWDTADIEVWVNDLPSAQSEIVRCKDCKHRVSYWGNCRLLEEKYHQSVLVDGDSFCSMAERRTDERTD